MALRLECSVYNCEYEAIFTKAAGHKLGDQQLSSEPFRFFGKLVKPLASAAFLFHLKRKYC
jgi:hypothetical protein